MIGATEEDISKLLELIYYRQGRLGKKFREYGCKYILSLCEELSKNIVLLKKKEFESTVFDEELYEIR